ncbi:MAG: bacterial Ig-like domain-containing protein [Treponema sp.]|nr:bacterial Ig-like domain-containing protein [Treponema sp.]
MKNLKSLAFSIAVLLIAVLTGCKSMQLVDIDRENVLGPARVRQGQQIDPREITINGLYKDGSWKVVEVRQNQITFNSHTPGPQLVRVRVGGLSTNQEATFMTEVMALRSLTVASPPRVTLFKEGQEPDPAWPGLEIRGEWDQMGSHKIELNYLEITGHMKDQPGRQVVRVTYEGIQTTFDIDVRGMASLNILQPPTKVDYFQGDTLDLTGLTVRGVWGDGIPDETLTIVRSDVTGYNGNDVGVQRLTVSKNGRSANFDVEVMGLSSIVLEKPPTKTDYYVGEALDLTGIEVTGNYTGADPTKRRSVLIPIEQLSTSGFESNRTGRAQRVTVIVRGQTANFFINITEAPPQAPQ